ncbi:MAG: glycosyltransferase family 4 protein [Microgenomates group bacterium]
MRIAQLAPLWKTVPPLKYGGTELVVSSITESLHQKKQDVTLFACEGSVTAARLIEVIDKPMYDLVNGFSWNAIQPYEFLLYDDLFSRLKEFDIIHNHLGFHPLIFSKLIDVPIITTLHSSAAPDFPDIVNRVKNNHFVSISNAQRKIIPDLNYVDTIYHGIDTKKYSFDLDTQGEYLLFVGSLTKNKGIDIAVKAAVELDEKLIIAGEIRREDEEFLKREVYPYIKNKKIEFVGEIDFVKKNELFSHAKALLFPIRWNEAFGLVMAESLASGTPVIAYNNGSVSEVLKNDITGYVVDDYEDFKKAILKAGNLSRKACREDAVNRFDIDVMADNYIKLYERILHS